MRFYAERVVPTEGRSGFVGTISDFTDLVNARGELHRVETLLRNTFDQAPIGVAYADRAGKFLSFNGAFSALLGYDPAELVGRSMRRAHARRGRRGGRRRNSSACGKAKSSFWTSRSAIGAEDGTYHLGAHDHGPGARRQPRRPLGRVSARHHPAQGTRGAARCSSERSLEAVISDLPVALLACDVEGRITHYNRAAVELHCITRATQPRPRRDRHTRTADVCLMDGVTPVAERAISRWLALCAARPSAISNSSSCRSEARRARRCRAPAG